MLKKCLYLLSVLCLIFFISNTVLASDVVMELNTSTNTNYSGATVDNTIYGAGTSSGDEILTNTEMQNSGFSVSNDYDVLGSDELSISNIINIILIVVGIVLILLGIAILLKLK